MTNTDTATLTHFGDSPYFIFCDHASNAVPSELNCLGMPEDMLNTHIAWDIGAGGVAEHLAQKLAATYFRCEYSRLLVDVNRDPNAYDIIPAVSDKIPIPGNQTLTETEKDGRIERYHVPYHENLSNAVAEMVGKHAVPFVISIHSFTHRLMGGEVDRPWKFGFLWREDEASARLMMDVLERRTGWKIGDNEPYDAREFNYSVDRHIGPRNLPHVTIEIRQDIISDDTGIEMVADHLAEAITEIMR